MARQIPPEIIKAAEREIYGGLYILPQKGTKVWAWNPDGSLTLFGIATGSFHRCTMACCSGLRISVKWPDGKHTQPCTDGMEILEDGSWRIL